jgi:hypothetical protein
VIVGPVFVKFEAALVIVEAVFVGVGALSAEDAVLLAVEIFVVVEGAAELGELPEPALGPAVTITGWY